MAKLIKKTLKNALSKNADDAIKGSRNIIELSSNNYKIKDATMPKSGSFSTRPSRKALNDYATNAQNPNFKTINQVGPIDYEVIDAEVKKSRKSIKDKIYNARQNRKNKNYNTPIEVKSYEVFDGDLGEEIAKGRENFKRREEFKKRPGVNANNATGSGNKAQRRVDEINRNKAIEARREESRIAQVQHYMDIGETDKAVKLMNKMEGIHTPSKREIKANRKKTAAEEKIRRQAEDKLEKEVEQMFGGFGDIDHTKTVNKKTAQPETSPAGGNPSAAKHLADKLKGNNTVYNMAAMGVGGGLVLNMANNKGQQSNAQLYGQY